MAENAEIQAISKANEELEKQLAEQKLEHENSIKDKDSEVGELQQKLKALEAELDTTRSDLDQQKTTNESINEECINTKRENEEAKKQTLSLNRQLHMANEKINSLLNENNELKQYIFDSEKPNDGYNSTGFPVDDYVDENTDIKKYIESIFRHYGFEVPIKVNHNSHDSKFFHVKFGPERILAKIENNKFYLKFDGGYETLKNYIERFIGGHTNNEAPSTQSLPTIQDSNSELEKGDNTQRVSSEGHDDLDLDLSGPMEIHN